MKRLLPLRRHRLFLTVVTALFLASLAGCAAGPRATGDPFAGSASGTASSASDRQLRIEVENTNFNEATVEARGIGRRQRLGRVPGTRSEVFTLDWTVAAPIYFEIDLLGGGRCTTRSIEVAGGQTVRLTIDSMARIRADGMSRICDAQRVR